VHAEALAHWGLLRQIKKNGVVFSSELTVSMNHTARRYAPEGGYNQCASNIFSAELIKSDKSDFAFQYVQTTHNS
jgi:hypothetical protein